MALASHSKPLVLTKIDLQIFGQHGVVRDPEVEYIRIADLVLGQSLMQIKDHHAIAQLKFILHAV